MSALMNLPAFLLSLGVIVFFHELGHHLVAKLFGVRVVTFSLGFGTRLWGFHHQGTDYRISAIPLGGYVRLGGELPDERTGDPHEFLSKPRWQRILVYLAGPAMNVVLSVALIAGVFMYGVEMQAEQDIPAIVGAVAEDSPAAAAGLVPGDRILRIDGQDMALWKDVALAVAMSPEWTLSVTIERDGKELVVELTPVKVAQYEYGDAGMISTLPVRIYAVDPDTPAARAGFEPGDEVRRVDGEIVSDMRAFVDHIASSAGREVEVEVLRDASSRTLTVVPAEVEGKGRIGVGLSIYRRLPFTEAVVESVKFNVETVELSVVLLHKLLTRQISAKSTISGPIEIAAMSGRALRRGFRYLVYLTGFLSISIGFMNLLPIPVLDGGHVFILLVESSLRRDLSVAVKERITQLGFMLLVTLMAVVIFFDLAKNLPGLMSGS